MQPNPFGTGGLVVALISCGGLVVWMLLGPGESVQNQEAAVRGDWLRSASIVVALLSSVALGLSCIGLLGPPRQRAFWGILLSAAVLTSIGLSLWWAQR